MELVIKFKEYLLALRPPPSKATVKNYVADVKHFIAWFETRFGKEFAPEEVTFPVIEEFQKDRKNVLSVRSLERHFSSLRKFFECLKLQGSISHSPFDQQTANPPHPVDPYRLKEFKDFLYVYNASHLTIKNYLIDVKQFLSWAEQVTKAQNEWHVADKNIFSRIDYALVAEYRERLFANHVLSPASINRKLSSLRKYLSWASENGLIQQLAIPDSLNIAFKKSSARVQSLPENNINNDQNRSENVNISETPEIQISSLSETPNSSKLHKPYSSFPPFRLMQKISKGIDILFEASIVSPITHLTRATYKAVWRAKGKPLFSKEQTQQFPDLQTFDKTHPSHHNWTTVSNLPKALYSPFGISTKHFSWQKKLWHHLRYTRPNWYKRYHNIALAHYFNWAILIIFTTAIGFGMYNSFVAKPKNENPALASAQPLRILSFQGRLTDSSDSAITTTTHLRFAIYSDPTASGSSMLWEEVDNITPDANGVFSVLLGSNGSGGSANYCTTTPITGACGIPQSIFADHNALYLGVSVGDTPELTPRQQLATVAYATNAETLQGLPPITQSGAGTSNVILALDSSGNLSIGASTTFQSTTGEFSLLGDSLLLGTNDGSNGNVAIAPNGSGVIDLQKPLVNTTLNNNITGAPGAVEVDDLFAVLATSAASAVTINQDGVGPLISASTSGTAKFTVGNTGSISSASYTTAGGILYSDATGLFLQSSAGNPGECLSSSGGGAPTWISCSGASNYWTLANGTLYPKNNTLDVFFGGTSSTSANFAFINNASGIPTASISGNLTLNSSGIIQTTNNQPLTLGGNTTGSIIIGSNFASSLIPSTNNTYDLGSASNEWSTLYVNNIIQNGSPIAQYLQRNAGVLSPLNISDDLAIGGTATNTAKFQVFANSGNATTAGSLTFNGTGNLIQTTNNQSLIIGGGTTGNITLSPLSGSGTVTISGLGTGVVQSNSGVLSTSAVDLATEVTNVLPLTNGGTNNSLTADNGGIVYSDATKLQILAHASSVGECLVSGGSGAPSWTNCATGVAGTNWWQVNAGDLFPLNGTFDLLIGGNSSSSANFAFINNASGIPTASISGNLTLNSSGVIQTTNNQPLTLGGDSTGNIILSPNSGNGIVTVNGTIGSNLIPIAKDTYDLGSVSNEWNNLYVKNIISTGTTSGFWQRVLGVLSPANITNDLAIGNTATNTAKFQVFANSGNATTAGSLTFNGTGNLIQTTNNQSLTIGGGTTGNITLSPLNGSGTVTIDGNKLLTTASSFDLLNTTATTINLGGAATTLNLANNALNTTVNIGGTSGTTTVNNDLTVTGTLTANGNVILGASGSNTINPKGVFSASLIPQSTSINLGATNAYYGDAYITNIFPSSSSQYQGFWQLNSGALSPTNITNDLLIGGTSTSSAKFQVFGLTGNATSSGNLTFSDAASIQTTDMLPLTLGGNTTGSIVVGNHIASSLIPATTNTYDLGASTLQWNNLYVHNLFQDGQSITQLWQLNAGVLAPLNITNDLAIGNTATNTAKFQVFANTGNATTAGNLTFSGSNPIIQTTSMTPLILGSSTTGPIQLSPNGTTGLYVASNGNVGIGTNTPSTALQVTANSHTIRFNPTAGSVNQIQNDDFGVDFRIYTTQASGTVNTNQLYLASSGTVSIGSSTPLGQSGLYVEKNALGNAVVAANQLGTGDIFTASSSGTTKFTIANDGTIKNNVSPNITNTYDLGTSSLAWRNLYVNGNYDGFWQRFNGTISPYNITDDLLIGGTSTNSAKFAVLNIANGTPVASVSSGLNGSGTYITASGTIQTTTNQPLTLGGNSTGNISLSPLSGIAGSTITFAGASAFTSGTGLTTLGGNLTVNGTVQNVGNGSSYTIQTSSNGALTLLSSGTGNITLGQNAGIGNVVVGPNAGGNAALIVNKQFTTGDIFTASSSGTTKFTIQNDGTIKSGKYTAAGGVLYTDSNGIFTQASNASANTVLHGGSTPTFSAIDLSADVGSSILPLGNGGTGANLSGDQGGIVYYSSNTALATLAHSSTAGACLLSGGSSAPSWGSCTSGTAGSWWNMNLGTLYPTNSTLDLLVGGSSTDSAKFAIINMTGSGTPTASVSGGLSSNGLSFDANGNIQTTNNNGLTIGGNTTGNITLAPLNSGTGSTLNLNALTIDDNKSTVSLLATPSTLNFGKSGGTINLGSATLDSTQATVTLFGTPTSLTLGGAATTFNLGKSGGTTTILGAATVDGNTTLGTNDTNTVVLNGLVSGAGVNSAVQPAGNGTTDLGSTSHYWGTVYAQNFIAPVTGGTSGFWQLTSNVISPINPWNDLAIGGNATGSATPWQVFATTVGTYDTAGTASSSGNLTFRGATTNLSLLNGSALNIKTSVGGDEGASSVLSIANNGDLTATGILNLNSGKLQTTQATAYLFNTTPTTINLGGNATTLNIGKASTSTTNIENALNIIGTLQANGDVISNLVPNNTTRNLGSDLTTHYWNTLYVGNILQAASAQYSGFWQLNNKVLSPFDAGNNDLAIGGTATGSAFQIFANKVAGEPAGTASTSGQLTFSTSSQVNLLNNAELGFYNSVGGDSGLNANPTLYLTNTSRVGIGTNTPGTALTISGANSNAGSVTGGLLRILDTGLSNSYFAIDNGNNGNDYRIISAGTSSKNLELQSGGVANELVLTTGGAVGMGTNSPLANSGLDIEKNALGNAAFVVNQSGLGDIFTASVSGTPKFTIANDGSIKNSLVPNLDGASGIDTLYNLGAATAEWDTLYVRQIVTPANGGIAGYWQLSNAGVLAPSNLSNDLAVGGTATSSALFHVYATTSGSIAGGTASTAANLTFSGTNVSNSAKVNLLNSTSLGFYPSPGGDAGISVNPILQLTSSGNVGVGIFNPTYKLWVDTSASGDGIVLNGTTNPEFKLYNSGSTESRIGLVTSAGAYSTDSVANDVVLRVEGTSQHILFNTNGGAGASTMALVNNSVGIGTTSPLASTGLHISKNALGNAAFVVDQLGNGDLLTASASGVKQFLVNTSGQVQARQYVDLDDSRYYFDPAATDKTASLAGNMYFAPSGTHNFNFENNSNVNFQLSPGGDAGLATALYIQGGTSNVGIGTTGPGQKLDVNGSINFAYQSSLFSPNSIANPVTLATVNNGTFGIANGQANVGIFAKDNSNLNAWQLGGTTAGIAGNANSTILTFNTNSNERMRIDASGNVGIGTATPSANLTVVGTSNDFGNDALRVYDNTMSGYMFSQYISTGVTTPYVRLGSYSASNNSFENFVINDGGGNVGIGTANPSRTLDVTGVWGGNEYDLADGASSDHTDTITTAAHNYFFNSDLTNPGANHTITFNITAFSDTEGTFFFVRLRANTNNSVTHTARLTVNGSGTIGSVLSGAPGAGNAYAVVSYWSGGWHAAADYHANNSPGFDLSEMVPSGANQPKPGELLTNDVSQQKLQIVKTTNEYDQKAVGIVTTNPNILFGGQTSENSSFGDSQNYIPISGQTGMALAGRVPAIVTSLDGPILKGDGITSSPIAGVGMLPTKATQVVGKALENFDPSQLTCTTVVSYDSISWPADDGSNYAHPCFAVPMSSFDSATQTILENEYHKQPTDYVYVGKALVLVGNSFVEPDVYLTTTGDVNIATTASPSADFSVPNYYTLSDALGAPITRMGRFLELAVGNLRAGSVQAQQTITNTLAVATDNVSIAGQSLHDYIASVVSQVLATNYNLQSTSVTSPIAEVDQLHTNLISPLASTSAIALSFQNDSRIEVRDAFSQKTVASIDNSGNATFSGKLNSQNLAVNNDATISGTLYANNIKANSIEGLAAVVGTLSAQNITNVTNIYFATPSGTLASGNITTGSNTSSSTASGLLAGSFQSPSMGYVNIASYSGFLAYVPNLSADTASFNQGLVSLGSTSLSDTTITGQLAIGSQLILSNNSVNVLGANFDIQPLAQGGVTFEGGLIAINTNGDLTVNGKAIFNNTLLANVISPLANDHDLTIQLGQNSNATGSALATANLSIHNASGSAIFAINQLGDFVASGEATIGKLNLNFVQPALAVSDTEVIATGSAGTTAVKAHQEEITIDNKNITAKSLIYITPVGNSGVIPYLLRQVPGGSFTVGIPAPLPTDTTFNWLIVN